MDTRIQIVQAGDEPNIENYTSSIELNHINEEVIIADLESFGNQSKSWSSLRLLTDMVEQNKKCLNEFSEKLTALKKQHPTQSLPSDLKNKITELEVYLSQEFERLVFTPAMLFMQYGHVFIQRKINASLRGYAFDTFVHFLKVAAVSIVKQCINPIEDVDKRNQAIADFNAIFLPFNIDIDIKESILNLSRISLVQDQHLDEKVQALLRGAQQFEYKSWTKTFNARAILEDSFLIAHKAIATKCKAYFASDQSAFNDFWGVRGPFVVISNTNYIGWSKPQFSWNWESGLDRLDYVTRSVADAAHPSRVTYIPQPLIDSYLTSADIDRINLFILEIPKSAVEVDGQRLGFLQALNKMTDELESLSAKINKLPKSQFVSATLFPATPASPSPLPAGLPLQLK